LDKLQGPPKSLLLGETIDSGKPLSVSSKTRKTHMHIIGSTGEGKSKFIEHLIRRDIDDNNGLCLIDPHGHLYHDVLAWCEYRKMLARGKPKKIILFDPSDFSCFDPNMSPR